MKVNSLTSCATDEDCPTTSGTCQNALCVRKCKDNEACRRDEVCGRSDFCVRKCAEDDECRAPLKCDADLGFCRLGGGFKVS